MKNKMILNFHLETQWSEDLVSSICAWKVFLTRKAIKLYYTLEGYFKLFTFSYDVLKNHIMEQTILIMHNNTVIIGDWNSDQRLKIK